MHHHYWVPPSLLGMMKHSHMIMDMTIHVSLFCHLIILAMSYHIVMYCMCTGHITYPSLFSCQCVNLINPQRACAARVTVVVRVCPLSHISPLERLFFLKILSHTWCISETAPLQRYTASCVVGYCSDIPRTFSMAEPSKGPKKANNRLNSTWNTTRCKGSKVFLFSLRLLPKVFRILPINVIRDLACALSRICARTYAEGSALQCIHLLLLNAKSTSTQTQ